MPRFKMQYTCQRAPSTWSDPSTIANLLKDMLFYVPETMPEKERHSQTCSNNSFRQISANYSHLF